MPFVAWNAGSADAGTCACFTPAVLSGAELSAEGSAGIAASELRRGNRKADTDATPCARVRVHRMREPQIDRTASRKSLCTGW